MEFRNLLFKELVKKGKKKEQGKTVFDIANRSFLYMTPELIDAFLKLRAHPRYKKTVIDKELALIKENSQALIKTCFNGNEECGWNLVDLGCGDGLKSKAFLESIKDIGKIRYCPITVNKVLVDLAMNNVKNSKFSNVKDYDPHVTDLESLSKVLGLLKNGEFRRNIILLLGSIIASFDIHDYLFNLSNSMSKGDYIIIGNGIRRGERFSNVENYQHPLFKDWFNHIVKTLGFQDEEVEYDARFTNSRVECFHTIKKDKKINYNGKEYHFRKGDEIIVAVLYKYFPDELEKFCKMYFCEVKLLKDPDEEYALIFCKK